ncbi:hypothetical protein H072_11303 [Dactylellina haptotyla CBS 200.50]|uniref:Uncharacterized protein n=1 Tax=Dactylellina haptotyla (strain CBS 200.50) TaxID=1284197 RepID=S8B8M2_DACHA|nr:hypothetical protein H072_11303 [Dactylellina haptotyla CBS 200.50]
MLAADPPPYSKPPMSILPMYNRDQQCLPFSDQESVLYNDIQTYYYQGSHEGGSILLDSRPSENAKYVKYTSAILPVLYIFAIITTTALHTSVVRSADMPYFLMALYNSTATLISMLCVVFQYSSSNSEDATKDLESIQDRSSRHWKPFAFVLLYLLSEEGFWLSLKSLPELHMHITYLAYPFFLALFTYHWVFGGSVYRLNCVSLYDRNNLQIVGMFGILTLCWSYEMSFEWWSCVVAVAMKGFKDVVARDIMASSSYSASELVMLASSALSVRALTLCFNSMEYAYVRSYFTSMPTTEASKVVVAGACYGIAQLLSLEILRSWEPIKRCWVVLVPAATGAAISLLETFR